LEHKWLTGSLTRATTQVFSVNRIISWLLLYPGSTFQVKTTVPGVTVQNLKTMLWIKTGSTIASMFQAGNLSVACPAFS
jgi:hypothetical protein